MGRVNDAARLVVFASAERQILEFASAAKIIILTQET